MDDRTAMAFGLDSTTDPLPGIDVTSVTGAFPIGGPAGALAARVREGAMAPTAAVDDALTRIASENPKINAFRAVRADARADARELAAHPELDMLPLAGVPVAVRERPGHADVATLTRLRGAGAIVVGTTAAPELGLWATTDAPGRVTRNPRDVGRTAGGAAGGAAAAVAAGLVPIAHGDDGIGSVRIPAAACGVFGIEPGRPVDSAPGAPGAHERGGVLTTTVSDAALALSVLSDRADLAEVQRPGRLRIGVAVAPPARLLRVDRYWTAAAISAGMHAAAIGHAVEPVEVPYGDAALSALLRWTTTGLDAAPGLLPRRTRTHLAVGRLVRRLRLVRSRQIDRAEATLLDFFENYDVVITPTLAAPPPRARQWSTRGWCANVACCVRFAPFTAVWNLVGWPAASLPMGTHPHAHTPLAAQLAGPPGSEATLLGLAAQLEQLG
uniref:amidase family protein n=2 Tax=Nocardia thailandica TaxID=257275 RepID=UPI000A05102B